LFIILLLAGFGAGYVTREFIDDPHKAFEAPTHAHTLSAANQAPITVCFTPNKQCQSKIIHEIESAKKSIFVQAYSFTDKAIANALANAAVRGIAVKVILDKGNRTNEKSAKGILLRQNIPLRFDAPDGIAHNKVMIIDGEKVISGSYNFSTAAYRKNTENLLLIHNLVLAQNYIQNWQSRWQASK